MRLDISLSLSLTFISIYHVTDICAHIKHLHLFFFAQKLRDGAVKVVLNTCQDKQEVRSCCGCGDDVDDPKIHFLFCPPTLTEMGSFCSSWRD